MFAAMNIAMSGMQAATRRIDVAASNIANMGTVGLLPGATRTRQPYQPLTVEQTTTAGGGVTTSTRPVSPASVASYDPTSSYANAQGMVAAPNIDPLKEFANMVSAQMAFAANAAVFKASDDMVKQLYKAMDDDRDDHRHS